MELKVVFHGNLTQPGFRLSNEASQETLSVCVCLLNDVQASFRPPESDSVTAVVFLTEACTLSGLFFYVFLFLSQTSVPTITVQLNAFLTQ